MHRIENIFKILSFDRVPITNEIINAGTANVKWARSVVGQIIVKKKRVEIVNITRFGMFLFLSLNNAIRL